VGKPVAAIVKVNGVPTVPAAVSGPLVMIGATPAAATVIVSVAVPVPVLFVALSAATKMPAVVGVPLILPVRELTRQTSRQVRWRRSSWASPSR
jgi:hypothetical protein